MSIKLASFDALTRQNKISFLTQLKKKGTQRQEDFMLSLHALLDSDVQVRMAGKMLYATFSQAPFFIDLKGLTPDEIRQRVQNTFAELVGSRPEVVEVKPELPLNVLSRDLVSRGQRFERLGEWDGPFPKGLRLLNALREDTQGLLRSQLDADEAVDRAWLAFYHEPLKPFREGMRSLDSHTAVSVVSLNHAQSALVQYPAIEAMARMLIRPIYLLIVLTGKKLLLVMRDEIKSHRATVRAIAFSQIKRITVSSGRAGFDLELELGNDVVTLPRLHGDDGADCEKLLRERSIEGIKADESFLDRDFDKEMQRLDLLYRAKAISPTEYGFRKRRLQKMELEKFSDANVEAMLAKRFSDSSAGSKFDAELIKRFTAEKTIMFTDIVGYSRKAAEKMLLDTVTLLAVHDKMLMPLIQQHQGQLIKKIGDALMVKFDSALEACRAAAEMQAALIRFNRTSAEKILIRIGINTGTVFARNQDVFGDAVNVAARMESMAKPGMIMLTEATWQRLEGRLECRDLGERVVKGQTHPLRVFTLIDETRADQEMIAQALEFAADQEGGSPGSAGEEAPPGSEAGATPSQSFPRPDSLRATDTARPPSARESGAAPRTEAGATVAGPIGGAPDAGLPGTRPTALPPTSAPEAFARMAAELAAAVASYKAAIRLGAPRDAEAEHLFRRLVGEIAPRLGQYKP